MLLTFLANIHRLFLLKDEKRITITNAFQKILDEAKLKPNKIWNDTISKFHNNLKKSRLEKSEIEICLTYNEGKSLLLKYSLEP